MLANVLPRRGPTPDRRRSRGRATRVVAVSAAAALAVTGLNLAAASGASADTPPRAQAVGNFLDGMVGQNPIQDVVKLADAHAQAPGATSVQNPLDVTALKSINLPLTGALQLDELFKTINVGAANQVAVAKADGYSYGASGAVNNQGGASIGGQQGIPQDAVIELGAGSLNGTLGNLLDSLGSIKLSVGAVSGLAQTKSGGTFVAPSYNIAGLQLSIESTALGDVLGPLTSAVDGLLPSVNKALGKLGANAPDCSLTSSLSKLDIAGGAVVLNATNGALTINLQALLDELGLDLNHLPANTDLIDVLLHYLTDTGKDGFVAGLTKVLDSVVNPLTNCVGLLGDLGTQLTGLLGNLLDTVQQGSSTLTGLLSKVLGGLAPGSADNPLAPLANALKQLIDIGINVQTGPGAAPTNAQFPFTSQLKATANQSKPVVKDQTVVRAIEINLVGDPLATIALANAAAGPSTLAPPTNPTTSTTPTNGSTSTPSGPGTNTDTNTSTGGPAGPNGGGNTDLPNGIPAGMATHGGSPALPLVLAIIGLVLAGGGAVAWKVRAVRLH